MNHQVPSAKVVPFKTKEGISQHLIRRLHKKGEHYGLNRIIPFPTAKIIVANWVRLKCRYGCSRYNTSWCCPPATLKTDRVQTVLDEYETAILLVGSTDRADFYLNNNRKRAKQVRCWKGVVSLERLLFIEGYYKAFSLVSECCALCKTCVYPQACKFPQEKRPSVESFSIDIFGTLKTLGLHGKVAGNRKESYNYYSIILLE